MVTHESFDLRNLPPGALNAKFLKPDVIVVIERALNNVGPFGEVQLVIEKGNLRYIRTIKSEPVEHAKI